MNLIKLKRGFDDFLGGEMPKLHVLKRPVLPWSFENGDISDDE
jgi:hypothetical protein